MVVLQKRITVDKKKIIYVLSMMADCTCKTKALVLILDHHTHDPWL